MAEFIGSGVKDVRIACDRIGAGQKEPRIEAPGPPRRRDCAEYEGQRARIGQIASCGKALPVARRSAWPCARRANAQSGLFPKLANRRGGKACRQSGGGRFAEARRARLRQFRRHWHRAVSGIHCAAGEYELVRHECGLRAALPHQHFGRSGGVSH